MELARRLKPEGVDRIDCSSAPLAKVPLAPGNPVEFARSVRHSADIASAALGLITEPRRPRRSSPKGTPTR